jgi:SAM-dependent methyltransferase
MSDNEGSAGRVEELSQGESSPFLDAWFDLTSADHFWFQWRLRATWDLLENSPLSRSRPLHALEVGCGTGVLLAQFEAETAWRIDGADLDRTALEHVPTSRGRVLFYDLNDRLESLGGTYDLIILYDVLEHIPDTAPFLASLFYHLKPGGHLLINVPAVSWLFGRYDEAAGHERRYNKRTLVEEFRDSADIVVTDVRYWGLSLIPIVAIRKGVSRWQRRSQDVISRGFQPPGEFVHRLLKLLMRIERALIRRPPLGSSLLLLARKDSEN